jgi:hypothetical protein
MGVERRRDPEDAVDLGDQVEASTGREVRVGRAKCDGGR